MSDEDDTTLRTAIHDVLSPTDEPRPIKPLLLDRCVEKGCLNRRHKTFLTCWIHTVRSQERRKP